MDAIFIGVDVSKDRLDVCCRPSGAHFAVARNGAGIEELAERLTAMSPTIIAIEATGGFETTVAAGLSAKSLPVVVVNPAQVRAFALALGKRAKTDPIDAAVIAHFPAEATKPPKAAAGFAAQLHTPPVGGIQTPAREEFSPPPSRSRRQTRGRFRASLWQLRRTCSTTPRPSAPYSSPPCMNGPTNPSQIYVNGSDPNQKR